MSYKSIDLQASLPRAAEMSPLVQHQQHRSAAEQGMLAQQTLKSAEQNAQRMTKTESASNGGITDRQPGGSGGRQPLKRTMPAGGMDEEENRRSEHPFKGKHIDFMG